MSRYFSRLAKRSGLSARESRPQTKVASSSSGHQFNEILAVDLAAEKTNAPSLSDSGVLNSKNTPFEHTHSDNNVKAVSLVENDHLDNSVVSVLLGADSRLRINNSDDLKTFDNTEFNRGEKRDFGSEVVEKTHPKILSLPDQDRKPRIDDLPLPHPLLKKSYEINEQQMSAIFLDKLRTSEKRTVKERIVEAKPLSLSVTEFSTIQRPVLQQNKQDVDKQKAKDQNESLVLHHARIMEIKPSLLREARSIKESVPDEPATVFGRPQNYQHDGHSAISIKIGKISVDVHQSVSKSTAVSNTTRKSVAPGQQETRSVRLSRYYLRAF